MTILGIETSCDETAISIVLGRGGLMAPRFKVRSQIISSQAKIHEPWGGVVPRLAKREHGKNLVPVLKKALEKSKSIKGSTLKTQNLKIEPWKIISKILAREPELLERFLKFIPTIIAPKIDAIAVTYGPGLEPALWTGINFAQALALVWDKPLIPINHLEGHIYSVLVPSKVRPLVPQGLTLKFPALALLISGGHTELVFIRDWFKYRVIGQTRDDAVGEAFDKTARLLGLPYPGGRALAKLAARFTRSNLKNPQGSTLEKLLLPRPMIDSPDLDFSFSGLKTAVFYLIQKIPRTVLNGHGPQGQSLKIQIAAEFQQSIIDVLIKKTLKAIDKYRPRTLIVAGGVSANKELRRQLAHSLELLPRAGRPTLFMPPATLATDNATMIAMAGYLRLCQGSNRNQGETLSNLKVSPLIEPLIRIRARGRLVLK